MINFFKEATAFNKEPYYKHTLLEYYIDSITNRNLELFTAIPIDEFYVPLKKKILHNYTNKALKYLIVNKYFTGAKKDNIQYIYITQKGIDAYNSEEFLTIYQKERSERRKNRISLLFSAIIVIGVIVAIFKDNNQGQKVQKIIIDVVNKHSNMPVDSVK